VRTEEHIVRSLTLRWPVDNIADFAKSAMLVSPHVWQLSSHAERPHRFGGEDLERTCVQVLHSCGLREVRNYLESDVRGGLARLHLNRSVDPRAFDLFELHSL